MSSFSQTIIQGNVGKDPVIKTFQSGDRIANFSVATSETWKDKNSGERKEKTEWHNVVIKNDGLAGVVERYIKKGSKVLIVGQNQTRKYEKNGQDCYTTEVVVGFGGTLKMLGDAPGERGNRDDNRGGSGGSRNSGGYGRDSAPSQSSFDNDDDIPF